MITMYQVRHDNNVYLPSASHFIMFHFFYSKQYIVIFILILVLVDFVIFHSNLQG